MRKISITKNELLLMLESLTRVTQKNNIEMEQHKKIKIQKLITKFKKLSPYYEYLLEPIQYDEF